MKKMREEEWEWTSGVDCAHHLILRSPLTVTCNIQKTQILKKKKKN